MKRSLDDEDSSSSKRPKIGEEICEKMKEVGVQTVEDDERKCKEAIKEVIGKDVACSSGTSNDNAIDTSILKYLSSSDEFAERLAALIHAQTKSALQEELGNLSEVIRDAIREELTPMLNQLTASLQNVQNNIIGTVNQIRTSLENRMNSFRVRIEELERQKSVTTGDVRAINNTLSSAIQMIARTTGDLAAQRFTVTPEDFLNEKSEATAQKQIE